MTSRPRLNSSSAGGRLPRGTHGRAHLEGVRGDAVDGMVLLAYDPGTGRLELVDPKTGGPPLLEEKPRKEATRPKVPAKKKAAKRLVRRRGAVRCGRGSPGGDRIVGTHEQMPAFRNGSRRGTHISAGTTRRAFGVWGRASRGWLLLAARLPCRILMGLRARERRDDRPVVEHPRMFTTANPSETWALRAACTSEPQCRA
jgi:hypothetical protein